MKFHIAVFGACIFFANFLLAQAQGNYNYKQAEMMIEALKIASLKPIPEFIADSILSNEGTNLIIDQQNTSRKVTKEQYECLLNNLNLTAFVCDQFPDSSEKAAKGLSGLRKDIWPSLQWGKTHVSILEKKLSEIRKQNLASDAVELAYRYLPEQTPGIIPGIFIVMGGRAGAASFDNGVIYFDLLITAYRETLGQPYPSLQELIEFFAHETHHLGLNTLIKKKSALLSLTSREQFAWDYLTSILLEGSATYLINGHRSLDVLEKNQDYADIRKFGDSLLLYSDSLLEIFLNKDITSEEYDRATIGLAGSGWHKLGSYMFSVIDRAYGINMIMNCLEDPRIIILTYNNAVKKLKMNKETHIFRPQLAKQISLMGNKQTKR